MKLVTEEDNFNYNNNCRAAVLREEIKAAYRNTNLGYALVICQKYKEAVIGQIATRSIRLLIRDANK